MENYLQRAWSDSVDNIGIDEIKAAILEIQTMDDEHGAFWVGVVDKEETILETDKNGKVTLILNGDDKNAVIKRLNEWNEIIYYYELLLNGDFAQLSSEMNDN